MKSMQSDRRKAENALARGKKNLQKEMNVWATQTFTADDFITRARGLMMKSLIVKERTRSEKLDEVLE
ncbi:hypothetical protein RHMOL_Rhmol13G0117500 [Rhododendron molle]|uniref:Uncharacterized protein n=1 Tax=Rhododendron molle TaxID=49168 RepID=A0ACC0L6N2_RHOML|nr:hypothetical protein RHMOL_Rhmol13G0117500 [Rhododendron molle]